MVNKKDKSLYWITHFNFGLAVINVCPVLVSSELSLRTRLPMSEGWTAELTVGLWLMVPMMRFKHRREDWTRFKTLYLNDLATPLQMLNCLGS